MTATLAWRKVYRDSVVVWTYLPVTASIAVTYSHLAYSGVPDRVPPIAIQGPFGQITAHTRRCTMSGVLLPSL